MTAALCSGVVAVEGAGQARLAGCGGRAIGRVEDRSAGRRRCGRIPADHGPRTAAGTRAGSARSLRERALATGVPDWELETWWQQQRSPAAGGL